MRRLPSLPALALASLTLLGGTSGCYLTRGAWEEAKILSRRRPIAEMISDPATPSAVRAKLAVVSAARLYARDEFGLRAKESFTSYSYVESDTLVLVLSAAYSDRLELYRWWFPIVGRVPYKGYFDFAGAREAARKMEADGFDVILRPSDAFSTLGYFNDPLLNTTLRADSLDLASTVFHELTHNTFYAPSQVAFNESFASFVGMRGAAAFFRARGDTAAAARLEARWSDDLRLGAFWTRLSNSLDSAFRANPGSRAARLAARDAVYTRARATLVDSVAPFFRVVPREYARRVKLDNAAVLSRRIYYTGLDLFDAVLAREGGDLRRAVARVATLARSAPDAPFAALSLWLGCGYPHSSCTAPGAVGGG